MSPMQGYEVSSNERNNTTTYYTCRENERSDSAEELECVTYDELEIGQSASVIRTIKSSDIKGFAAVSGDVNPAHLDKEFAKKDIFKGIVAHGMLSGALISTVLGTQLPGPGTIYLNQSIRFCRPVRIGDVVTVTLTVAEKRPNYHAVFNCKCTNQKGEIVSSGIAEVIAPKEKIYVTKPEVPELELMQIGRFCKQFIEKAQSCSYKPRVAVIYPCSDVALEGAIAGYKDGLIIPVLVGPTNIIKKVADNCNLDIESIEIVDVQFSAEAAAKGVRMIHDKTADFLMKGSLHTSEFLAAIVDPINGLRGERRISHCCVMDIPNYPHPLLITDIAVNIAPDLMAKKDITQNAIDLAHALGIKRPKVAILSAEETISPRMPSTIDAAALCKMSDRGQITGAILDGPLAFDVAVSTVAAEIKKIKSSVSGNPDILIAPGIESANILAKEFKYFTHASMPGLVLGAKVPVVLTSRADDTLSRTTSCALAVLYVEYLKQIKEENKEEFPADSLGNSTYQPSA